MIKALTCGLFIDKPLPVILPHIQRPKCKTFRAFCQFIFRRYM